MVNEIYLCPSCGQSAKKPPWLISRENGFDESIHCTMMANQTGKVINCPNRGRIEKLNEFFVSFPPPVTCENCKIKKHFTETKKDKNGREFLAFKINLIK